jgi:mycothiol S-conjugate amidase
MQGYNSVADLRLAELDCAATVLGIKETVLFGYRDSGMMGSADNADPRSLWQAPLDVLTNRIAEVMRRTCPQVVITFDPYGGYGHPDHIKMNEATVAAFKALQTEPEHPQKLYYGSIQKFFVRFGLFMMRLSRQDPRKAGVNHDMDFQAVYEHILPTHTKINAGRYFEVGQRAAQCHASQIPWSGNPIMLLFLRTFMGTTSLTRAYPEPKPGEPVERDLFAGVVL